MRIPFGVALAFVCSATFAADNPADNRRRIDVWQGGGIFAQVVDGAEWKTSLYFHNMGTTTIYAAILMADDTGKNMPFPFTSGSTAALQFTLAPNTTTSFETVGSGALKQGGAFVFTCDRPCLDVDSRPVYAKLGALAVFRWRAAGKQEVEAVVPLEFPDIAAHVLFDNRQGYATGFVVLNGADFSDTISIAVRDNTGAILTQESLDLKSWERKVFMIADRYAATAGKQGCIEIAGRSVVAMALRASPAGALSSSHAMVPVP